VLLILLAQVDAPKSSVQVASTFQNLNMLCVVNCDCVNPECDGLAFIAKLSTESKEWLSMPGKMCTIDAALFNSGMSNDAVWVDSMVAPFGRRTVNGF
jgi:hypothetical protein